ncbi:MAG: phosphotransferase [Acidimicrobiales bacterium]|nr:phosphotransferase [Acidimicrobiales bacterium]MCB1014978.1 phosphotransferase [Acidimicrobiales bacterium]
MGVALTPRPVAGSVDELLEGVTRREPWAPAASRSTTAFERVWIDGESLLVKHLHLDADFVGRTTGDIGCRPLRAWAAGLYDVAPDHIDHAVVGVAQSDGRNGWGAALLLRDVGDSLASTGDRPFTEAEHLAFLDGIAAISSATWGWEDDLDLLSYPGRWQLFAEAMVEGERGLGFPEPVPAIAAEGWTRFFERAPAAVADGVGALWRDVAPLADALALTPSCFLHGDWKNGNIGLGPDGRVVLIDWVYLGAGPVCHELGWYLALNRDVLPAGRSKEDVIVEFRSALESAGLDTADWWARQLTLALLGTVVQFGWEKALGDDAELGWWCDRAAEGLAAL